MVKKIISPCVEHTILLIEPDEFLADIYEKNLVMEGFKVVKTNGAERALSLIKTKKFSLALVSASLPKMNGFEFLEAIKSNSKTANLPVIIISKTGNKEDVVRSRVLGASGYVIKSHFQPSEVVDKIKRILFKKS
jgi:DNA-binding response OmpR family regulator